MTEDGQRRTHRCRARTSSWNAPPVRAGTISRPRTGGSIPSGPSGRSTARGATNRRRIRSRSSVDGGTRTPRVGRAASRLGVRDGTGAGGSPQGHLAQLGRAQKGGRGDPRVRDQPGRADPGPGLDAADGVRDGGGPPVQSAAQRRHAGPVTAGPEEVNRLLGIEEAVREEEPQEQIPFLVGQVVEITEGPFSDFSGTVEEVIPDKGKVRVAVSLFGRPTSVELDYLQLKAH